MPAYIAFLMFLALSPLGKGRALHCLRISFTVVSSTCVDTYVCVFQVKESIVTMYILHVYTHE